MEQNEILEEIYRIREEHAKSFNYDLKAICEDWRRRQVQGGRKFVTLPSNRQANNAAQVTE